MRLAFWQDLIATWVVSALGSLGIFLAAIGLYGIISHRVSQRRHELGIRMALGAAASDVMRMVLVHGLKLASLGTAIGLVASFGAARLMSSLLYGVRPTDPLAFGASAMIVLLVALGASYGPARRALRLDPLDALRSE
jgi:putative ABC transport system permease protein